MRGVDPEDPVWDDELFEAILEKTLGVPGLYTIEGPARDGRTLRIKVRVTATDEYTDFTIEDVESVTRLH